MCRTILRRILTYWWVSVSNVLNSWVSIKVVVILGTLNGLYSSLFQLPIIPNIRLQEYCLRKAIPKLSKRTDNSYPTSSYAGRGPISYGYFYIDGFLHQVISMSEALSTDIKTPHVSLVPWGVIQYVNTAFYLNILLTKKLYKGIGLGMTHHRSRWRKLIIQV